MLTITNETLPVSVDELKSYLRIDFDDDIELERCIKAATNWIEHEVEKDLVARTWVEVFPCFQSKIRLARSPYSNLISIKYYDPESQLNTYSGNFRIRDNKLANPVLEIDDIVETEVRTDAVQITYVTGWANPAAKQAVLWGAAHFYLNRETEVIGASTSPLKLGIDRLITQLKTGGYF